MSDLVTADEAKTYLRLTGSAYDAELALKIPQASALVLNYITIAQADLAGDDLAVAQAVTLECLKSLMSPGDGPPLGGDQKNMLRRLRKPSLA